MLTLQDFSHKHQISDKVIHVICHTYRKKHGRNAKWHIKTQLRNIYIDESLLFKIEKVKYDLWDNIVNAMNFLESHDVAKMRVAEILMAEHGWSNQRAYERLVDAQLVPLPNKFFTKIGSGVIEIYNALLELVPPMIKRLRDNDELDPHFYYYKINKVKNMELLDEI